MSEYLFQYHKVHPTTWVYLSSLLMLGLFFKFGRFWSVRNLDLFLLILLAPGLLLVQYGGEKHALSLRQQRQDVQPDAEPTSADPGAEPEPQPPPLATSAAPDGKLPDGSEWTVFAEPREANGPQAATDSRGETGEPPTGGSGKRRSEPTASRPPPSADSVGSEETLVEGARKLAAERAGTEELAAEERAVEPGEADRELEESTVDRPLSLSRGNELSEGQQLAKLGFLVLFGVGALVLLRALIDPTMVRRPLLEPNLSTGGLTFIGCSLFIFLMANVLNSKPTADDVHGVVLAERLMARQDVSENDTNLRRHGPGYAVLNFIPRITTMPLISGDETVSKEVAYATVAKIMAILSHLAVVVGIVAIGYRHFDNIKMGIGAATLYLMLPYTAQMTGRVDHVLPAALLVWAVLCYRRPLASGMFIGLAIGVVYYPLFLLPLWISFYWHRGLGRFLVGVLSMLGVLVVSLVFISSDLASFLGKVQQMFGLWIPFTEGLAGIWGLGWAPAYRLPVLAGFIALCGSLALWPAQKNLGTLLSCSAAVMVATQFWHGFGGGTYIAWYLPLILLTIFRPNLEDRIALSVLGEGWFGRRNRNRLRVRAA